MADEKSDEKNQPILTGSMTEVRTENGRLFKVLPAIEAVTEYIGDYIYYQISLHHAPDYIKQEYLPILASHAASQNKKKSKKHLGAELGLDITKSTKYVVFPEVAKPAYCQRATPNDDELKNPPIQIPLEYSRPLYNARTLYGAASKITKDTFTVRNVEEVAVIAWLDYVLMNDDRFEILGGKTPNTKNMMLAPKTNGFFVYVPIDQGFCRQLTAAWFHWLEIKPVSRRTRTWPKYPKEYKQLIYSEQWINKKNEETPNSKMWTNRYKKWISNNKHKANTFVAGNHAYFPDDEAMRKKAEEIIDIYWNVHGVELCANIGSLLRDIFNGITNIPKLITLSNGGVMQKIKYIKDYRNQWKTVKKLIEEQIKQCVEFKPVAVVNEVKKMKAIREAARADKLLKDFTFQQLQNLNDDEKQAENTRRQSISKSIEEVKEDNYFTGTDSNDETYFAKQLEINEYYGGTYYDAFSVPYYKQNEYEYVLHPDPVQTLFTMEVIFVFAFLVLICVGCFIIGAFMGMVAVNRVNLALKKKPERIWINDEESQ